MDISRSLGITNANSLSAANKTSKPQASEQANTSSPFNIQDVVDISATPETAPTAETGEVRTSKIAEIRRQIADGSYDTDEKLNLAMEKMFDRIG